MSGRDSFFPTFGRNANPIDSSETFSRRVNAKSTRRDAGALWVVYETALARVHVEPVRDIHPGMRRTLDGFRKRLVGGCANWPQMRQRGQRHRWPFAIDGQVVAALGDG